MKANKRRSNKIYNLKNGTIEIYNFEPIRSRIAYFRLKEMQKIDEDERVLIKDYNNTWFASKKNVVYKCGSYNFKFLPPKNYKEQDENDLLLKRYIEGAFRNGSIHVLSREDIIGKKLYYLNPKDPDTEKYLQLTKGLYLEYLLENEYFTSHALQEENLTKEKDLFHISKEPIMQCSLEDLEAILRSGLVNPENYDEKVEQLEGSTKVFEKLKKQKRA